MNKLEKALDWLMERVGKMPSTNLRILVTLGLVIATGVVYLFLAIKTELFGLHHAAAQPLVTGDKAWVPDGTWLTFLGAMSGLDSLTFLAKRATDSTYVAARQSGATPVPEGK